jgi:hypothetical protein
LVLVSVPLNTGGGCIAMASDFYIMTILNFDIAKQLGRESTMNSRGSPRRAQKDPLFLLVYYFQNSCSGDARKPGLKPTVKQWARWPNSVGSKAKAEIEARYLTKSNYSNQRD